MPENSAYQHTEPIRKCFKVSLVILVNTQHVGAVPMCLTIWEALHINWLHAISEFYALFSIIWFDIAHTIYHTATI